MTEPRRWYLRVCPCGQITAAGTPCAGFPGAWNEEHQDFDRSACLGEVVEVVSLTDVVRWLRNAATDERKRRIGGELGRIAACLARELERDALQQEDSQ